MTLGYAGVQCLPALSEQAFISGVSHQCVLEDVGGCRGNAAAEDELGGDQSIERCLEIGLRQRNDGGKQFVIELPADAGADLCNLLHPGARRSRRAISELCRVAGIAEGGSGPART